MTAVILVGQLTFSVFAAYAFARLEFPGRDALFWVYLATLMVPATVTVVPLYLMMAQAGLRNTFWALVLPFMFGSPYAIFLSARVLSRHPRRSHQGGPHRRRQHPRRSRARRGACQQADPGDAVADHRCQPMEQLHVAAGDHQRRQVAGADGGDGGSAVPLQRAVDVGDGGDDGGDRSADRAVHRVRPAHRPLHCGDGAQV